MKILAIEPYYGGSHKAFIDSWIANSRHDWTICSLPPYKWKWRMRHGAITFAQESKKLSDAGCEFDAIFCSDMLNLAEFNGLADDTIKKTPKITYFHENQLTYPVRFESERDYQFAMTNLTTALAADAVWFNSHFHRESFLEALGKFLAKMPDYQPLDAIENIRKKSDIHFPGIETSSKAKIREAGPLHILWAARWEHDKNPEDFFEALKRLKKKNIDFRLSVIGESFRDIPEVFEWAKEYFADSIRAWGYQPDRQSYNRVLGSADVIVSTAIHEFFGISVLEAIAAGCYPVLPNRLAYPQIISAGGDVDKKRFIYDGSVKGLTDRLAELAKRKKETPNIWGESDMGKSITSQFIWPHRAVVLDNALENIVKAGKNL